MATRISIGLAVQIACKKGQVHRYPSITVYCAVYRYVVRSMCSSPPTPDGLQLLTTVSNFHSVAAGLPALSRHFCTVTRVPQTPAHSGPSRSAVRAGPVKRPTVRWSGQPRLAWHRDRRLGRAAAADGVTRVTGAGGPPTRRGQPGGECQLSSAEVAAGR